jgi:lysine decarboxylase
MLALVDEAHGPHFHFSTELPVDGIRAGADIVVQSTHKILGALSQASLLHCRRERISVPRLETMLQLTQSSSPNYILLASLEVAIRQMAEAGPELVERSIRLARSARDRIQEIPGLLCFGAERTGAPGVFAHDPTKLAVTVSGLGIQGNDAEMWLRCVGKVQAELSDWNNVLFLITLADDQAAVDRLVDALQELSREHAGGVAHSQSLLMPLPTEEILLALSPREAMFSRREPVSFAAAAGRICAETVTCYPPGIPILVPGEQITPAVVCYCQTLRQQGYTILGRRIRP